MTATPTTPDGISLIFRFRDLIAATLTEHRAVIEKYGACWWGWWKRPNEDARRDVWEDLSTHCPVRVGLFDSGSGKVYAARVERVIPPPETPDVSLATPKVPPEEQDLIPQYYRTSPFSRGWLRLTSIEPDPAEFFGRYSYAEAPKVPHYSPEVLRRLEGKVIPDPDELRGMDTTIWRVRPRTPTDPEEKILLTTPTLGRPVSWNVVTARSDVVLHLTDLHFATGRFRSQHVWRLESESGVRPTLVEAISQALDKQRVGLVIVSGDLTFLADPGEFAEARVSLQRLLGILDLDTDRLVVVPGNHDIRWTRTDSYEDGAVVTEAPPTATQAFRDFYRSMYGHDADARLCMGRRFALPCGLTLQIAALNSSSLEAGPDFLAGMGRIEESAFQYVANELRWNEPSFAMRWLVLHHHLALTEDREPADKYSGGFGIAIDACRIMRLAARRGVHLALHGHQHRAFVWRSNVYELPEHTVDRWRLGELSLLGGGSAGSTDTEGKRNYFNLLTLGSAGVRLEMYRSNDGGLFQLMKTWTAAVDMGEENTGLRLHDWRDA